MTGVQTCALPISMILPGLGQAYNKKYWKMPIIYAGVAGLIYSIGFADKRYRDYREAYIMRTDTSASTIDKYDPQLINEERKYSEEMLLELKGYYRKNRDLSYIGMAGLYLMNIIDAYVDAHFFNFDISDDLTLHVKPDLRQPAYSDEFAFGMRFVIKL